MRALLPILLLLPAIACSSSSSGRSDAGDGPGTLPRTRVVLRQYTKSNAVLVIENIAGRDLVELRSRPIEPGRTPVAYCPDDVMERLLEELEDAGYRDYARPRPADPQKLGARAEIILWAENQEGGPISFLRTPLPRSRPLTSDEKRRARSYRDCLENVFGVWQFYRPVGVVVEGGGAGEFGKQR